MKKIIFVLAEHLKGKLTDTTFEMLGKARELADQSDATVLIFIMGHKVDSLASQLGLADEIYCLEHETLAEFSPEAFTTLTLQQIQKHKPWLIMIAATSMGLDVSSIVSAKLEIPLIASCKELNITEGKLISTNQLYGGKIYTECEITDDTTIISILPGSFRSEKGISNNPAKVQKLPAGNLLDTVRTRFEKMIEPEAGDVDITQVPVLVSVGRGIQNQDNLPLAQELADALGGTISASRPVVDQGWVPTTRQVGRSGMTVKPKLYLALGISGAPEHIEGMKDSELIIAINSDPKAPIFNIAQYGVVADAQELIPALKEAIVKRKG